MLSLFTSLSVCLSVCLSLCLSVCLLTSRKNYWSDLYQNFTRGVSLDKEELVTFWRSPASGFGSRIFEGFVNTAYVRGHFSTIISGKKLIWSSCQLCHRRTFGKEVPTKFWKSDSSWQRYTLSKCSLVCEYSFLILCVYVFCVLVCIVMWINELLMTVDRVFHYNMITRRAVLPHFTFQFHILLSATMTTLHSRTDWHQTGNEIANTPTITATYRLSQSQADERPARQDGWPVWAPLMINNTGRVNTAASTLTCTRAAQ